MFQTFNDKGKVIEVVFDIEAGMALPDGLLPNGTRGTSTDSMMAIFSTQISVGEICWLKTHAQYPSFDNSWWHNQMKTFSALLAFCVGNSLVTSEFP